MKIALLSFHNAANYGAVLQAYALQAVLKFEKYDSLYIDYRNAHRRHTYDMIYQALKCLRERNVKGALMYVMGTPFMFIRKMRFRKFCYNYIKTTSKVYFASNELYELNNLFDKFIVGSDQVWNLENTGGDFAYMLDFVSDNNKKISYSSSFGISNIPNAFRVSYSRTIGSIKYLAVREQIGVNIVKDLTGRDAELVLDPVFLLPRSEWEKLTKPIKEKFVFSYTNRKTQFNDFVKKVGYDLSGLKHYKLARATSLSDFFSSTVRVKYTMSPQEFLSVIRSSELVVSASFHCISLSIILNRPFVAILTGDKGKDERLINILSLLGLNKRIFSSSMTLEDVVTPINYEVVNEKMRELRKTSLDYLLNALKK